MTAARAKGRAKGQVQAAGVVREFWSVREFAAMTGAALDTVYRQMKSGALAYVPFGGEYRIPDRERQRLLNEAEANRSAS